MKSLVRITILVALFSLVIPSVSAQDDGGDTTMALSAVYVLPASGGSFADNGNGTYTLALQGIPLDYTWLINEPPLLVYPIRVGALTENWAAAEGLVAEASLGIEGLNVQMTVSNPVYDNEAASIAYTATVNAIVPLLETKDEPVLPETFDAATLSIGWTEEFQDRLFEGAMVRLEGLRATPEECQVIVNEYDALKAQPRLSGNDKRALWNTSVWLELNCTQEYQRPRE